MWRTTRILMLFVLAAISAACSARENRPEVDGATTSVQVENQAFLDMTVYVLEGTQRVRLGMVPGVSTRTFEIPERIVFGISSLRFQVDPIGSDQAPISQEISVAEGEMLRLVIPPGIR
jgi:hypothetical protein